MFPRQINMLQKNRLRGVGLVGYGCLQILLLGFSQCFLLEIQL